jgi:hypothetical protein
MSPADKSPVLQAPNIVMQSIPVVVGVSGHRDLVDADLPAIRCQVVEALARIERMTPNSTHLLISALAEGADQLVAEVAFERGWEVVALLPMVLDDFIEDFETESAQQRFRSLLDGCFAIRMLPEGQLDPVITHRCDQQYRDQGTELARQAQVVIVLWDGQPAPPNAVGTSWVVGVCREGPPPVEGAVLAAPETTGLIHIPVRRAKSLAELPVASDLVPSDSAHEKVLREIDVFNLAMRQCDQDLPDDLNDSLDWVIHKDKRGLLDKGTAYVLHRYAEADVLARKYQRQRKQVIISASLMAVTAAACQATYGAFSSQPWILAYGVAIVLAYGLYFLLFRLPTFRIEERFLEYRAFAEAARVQLFWRLSGLEMPVAEHYLQLVKSDVGWVREAVRSLGFQATLMSATPNVLPELVRDHWLKDQINYFFGNGSPEKPGNIAKRRCWQSNAERGAMLSFAFGALMVVMAGLGYLLPSLDGLKDAASAYSASFFLIAGVIKGFAATMGYEEEAANFEKAGAVFRNALTYVEAHQGDNDKLQSCILELGKYALAENADWLLQHRRNAFKIEN